MPVSYCGVCVWWRVLVVLFVSVCVWGGSALLWWLCGIRGSVDRVGHRLLIRILHSHHPRQSTSGACDQPNKYHFCSPKGGSCVTTPEGQDVCTFAWLYGDGSSASGLVLTSKVRIFAVYVCICGYVCAPSGIQNGLPFYPPLKIKQSIHPPLHTHEKQNDPHR